MTLTEDPDVAAAARLGGPREVLTPRQVRTFVVEQLAGCDLDGRSVCVIVPDGTRSCPLPLLLDAVHGALHGRVSDLTVLVALGTHAAMSPEHLATHVGYPEGQLNQRFPGMVVRNHEWWEESTFVSVGTIAGDRIDELSDGRLHVDVDVRINRVVVDADVALIVGPVFPHEVVGFSGGTKYLFPGVSAQDVINVSHWLGALISSVSIIGTTGVTPVRALINEAASLVPTDLLALCLVVQPGTGALHAAVFGPPEQAWAAAAEVSAETHVRYLDAPVARVLSVVPERYEDMWTGAKGFYKVEPVVADGGQVVIYAPHINQISVMHPQIAQLGYHCRDYYVKQWDRFKGIPWGELAHSTHLRGAGTYDPDTGVERGRVTVTLATGIPEEEVRAANLDYVDPATVDPTTWADGPDTLVVSNAGEVLYRLRSQVHRPSGSPDEGENAC
jgi:nickel-dependent lactate racemase